MMNFVGFVANQVIGNMLSLQDLWVIKSYLYLSQIGLAALRFGVGPHIFCKHCAHLLPQVFSRDPISLATIIKFLSSLHL